MIFRKQKKCIRSFLLLSRSSCVSTDTYVFRAISRSVKLLLATGFQPNLAYSEMSLTKSTVISFILTGGEIENLWESNVVYSCSRTAKSCADNRSCMC
jgi:hypothetical protein